MSQAERRGTISNPQSNMGPKEGEGTVSFFVERGFVLEKKRFMLISF